jgi:hypothetical protein
LSLILFSLIRGERAHCALRPRKKTPIQEIESRTSEVGRRTRGYVAAGVGGAFDQAVRGLGMAKKAAKKSKSKSKSATKTKSKKTTGAKKRGSKKGVVAKVAGSIASTVASVMPFGSKKKK